MLRKSRLHYGWIIVAASFLMVFIGLGLCNSPHGLYQVPVTTSTAMSRAQFSSISSYRFAAGTAINLMFGVIVKKLGLRKTALAGMLILFLSMTVYSRSTVPAMFYLAGILHGTGLALSGSTIVSALISNWFSAHRGAVLGVVLSSSGIGGAIFSQLVAFLIAHQGWRFSYTVTSAIVLTCAVITFLALRDRPSDIGLEPVGGSPAKSEAASSDSFGITLGEAMRGHVFYVLMAAAFFSGVLNNPIYTAVPSQMADMGLSQSAAASMTSLLFLSIAASKILLGIINDRFGFTLTLCICFISNITGLAILLFAKTEPAYMLFALIFGLSIPLENLMLSLVAGRMFGHKDISSFVGISYACSSAGIAVGNPLMGWCSDTFGSYRYMTTAGIIISAAVFAAMLIVTRKPCGDGSF